MAMRLRAVFRVEVASPQGVMVGAGCELRPFEVVVHDATVRITPEVVVKPPGYLGTGREGEQEDQGNTHRYLIALKGEVARKSDARELTEEQYELFRAPAAEALRQTLMHL
jgi:hypothetical protein